MNNPTYGAKLDFERAMSYGDYLDLDKLLSGKMVLKMQPVDLIQLLPVPVPGFWEPRCKTFRKSIF